MEHELVWKLKDVLSLVNYWTKEERVQADDANAVEKLNVLKVILKEEKANIEQLLAKYEIQKYSK